MYEDLWDRSRDTSRRPRVLINMVSTLDGKAAIGGKAGSIGGESDRRLMRILRSRADAIMIGAGTLRAEKISLHIPDDLAQIRASRGLPEQPLHIILCSATAPELGNIINPLRDNTILVINEEANILSSGLETRDAIRSPSDSQGRVDIQRAIETLRREHGVDLILAEGGPSLNHSLLSNGLADELHLTLAPKIIGGDEQQTATIVSGPSLPNQEHRLLSIHTSSHNDPERDLFLRYQLTKSNEPSEEITDETPTSFR